ncbi:UbiA family prenyltransferase [Desulfovibrio ferrophilus]|uniref:Protoheme IX farnesyltransferase n=1 Tax=Desulfovibrio ferrophilus TaxID=241368 RepID=A0A2Z6AUD5_9BACT|nr:UbiA family prenyltransferase [Desulfovibrio ferrophilus]BBD06796.1 putative Protoheme IX farnesyltransferase [Desulfovibrio ferrophilus]
MSLSVLVALARLRVSSMVGAATVFGALLAGGPVGVGLWAGLGSVLLCAGCSALNQVQERGRDRLMERTRERPLPSEAVTILQALACAFAFMAVGLCFYGFLGGWPLAALGLTVILFYNGLYTPLKPVSTLSLLLGGLPGAIPPLAGWLAVGGMGSDPRILAVCGVFYLWQVPHFWLIAERHREDYERAGFAVPSLVLPKPLRGPLMGLWMLAYFTAILGMALVLPETAAWAFASAAMGFATVTGFFVLGRKRAALISLNAVMALTMLCFLAT